MNFREICLKCGQQIMFSSCSHCNEDQKNTDNKLGSRSREWIKSENVGDQLTAKYRKGNLILEISGVTYRYIGVSRHIYEELIEDESPLAYYNKYIKGQYDEEEIY